MVFLVCILMENVILMNNIDLDIGLAFYWWQASVWTNADLAYSA